MVNRPQVPPANGVFVQLVRKCTIRYQEVPAKAKFTDNQLGLKGDPTFECRYDPHPIPEQSWRFFRKNRRQGDNVLIFFPIFVYRNKTNKPYLLTLKNFKIMKTNEILKIGNDLFVTNERKSIYKKEIFAECKTDKEKKNLRMKLRKKLDGFIATAIAFRNKKEELNKLRASWKEYATAIYQDINTIADANSNTEKSESIKQFLQLMTEPKQPKQSKPATTQTK